MTATLPAPTGGPLPPGGSGGPARGGWAARIAAATPEHRDRTVDAVRAVAITGVVLGHWLVTALVADPARPASIHSESPLSGWPGMTPVSWLLQTLGLFFFAGGYAAARGARGRRPLPWLAARLVRLVRPVLALAAVWVPAALLLVAAGAPGDTRHAVWSVIGHPLWFLLVYVALTAATPLVRACVVRCGPWCALVPLAVVAGTDLLRPVPTWLGAVDVLAGWLVPYVLGVAVAEGRLGGRVAGAVLLAGGVAGGVALVGFAGYPASAVGVPGDGWSNLDPPSLFAVALAAAQVGGYLLLRPWLSRALRRPAGWAPVAAVNLAAMTVYCWHQSALLLVSFAGMLAGRPAGLLDAPVGSWLGYRIGWLAVFAAVLAALVLLFHRFERPRRTPGGPVRPFPAAGGRSARTAAGPGDRGVAAGDGGGPPGGGL